jgi:hypothetical protein
MTTKSEKPVVPDPGRVPAFDCLDDAARWSARAVCEALRLAHLAPAALFERILDCYPTLCREELLSAAGSLDLGTATTWFREIITAHVEALRGLALAERHLSGLRKAALGELAPAFGRIAALAASGPVARVTEFRFVVRDHRGYSVEVPYKGTLVRATATQLVLSVERQPEPWRVSLGGTRKRWVIGQKGVEVHHEDLDRWEAAEAEITRRAGQAARPTRKTGRSL